MNTPKSQIMLTVGLVVDRLTKEIDAHLENDLGLLDSAETDLKIMAKDSSILLKILLSYACELENIIDRLNNAIERAVE